MEFVGNGNMSCAPPGTEPYQLDASGNPMYAPPFFPPVVNGDMGHLPLPNDGGIHPAAPHGQASARATRSKAATSMKSAPTAKATASHFVKAAPTGVRASSTAKSKAAPKAVAKALSRPAHHANDDDSDSDDNDCCSEYFRRLNMWKVHRMELFSWEDRFKRDGLRHCPLLAGNSLGEMVTRYLCWRRAVLQAAGMFWTISLSIHAVLLFISIKDSYLNFGSNMVFGVELGPYAEHFKVYIALEYAARSTIIIAGYIAVFLCFCAAYFWRRFKSSRPPAFVSYLLGYSTPFIVYLLLSQRTAVDIEAIQQHVCRDMVTGQYRDPNWVPGKLMMNVLGGTNAAGTSFMLFDRLLDVDPTRSENISAAFGIPVSFCDSDPDTWEAQIPTLLEQNGRLPGRDGRPCPKALNDHTRTVLEQNGLLPQHSKNVTDMRKELPGICGGDCLACKSANCIKYVPPTQRVRVGVGNLQDHEDAAAYFADNTCNKCNQPNGLWTTPAGVVTTWTCNSVCIKYWLDQDQWPNDETERRAELAQAAIDEHGTKLAVVDQAAQSLSVFDVCVSPSDVAALEFMTKVATTEWPWRLAIALRSAFMAFIALVPYLLSLMSGTIIGATVAKVVMPYSRIPALILTCAISYSLPYILLLAVLFKTLIGDNSLLPAAFFGVLTLLVFTPWQAMLNTKIKGNRDITDPQEHVEAESALGMRLKIHYVCLILFGIFFTVWLSRWATFLQELARSQLLGLEAETIREVIFGEAFWQKFGVRIAASVANYFGFSKIAGVVFADSVLWAIVMVDEANVDSKQALHQEEQELALFAELHRGFLLRPPKVAAQFDRIYRERQEQKKQRRKERLEAQLQRQMRGEGTSGVAGRLFRKPIGAARRHLKSSPPKPTE